MTKEDLTYVFQRLLVIYEPQTALKWLVGINVHLGNRRPVDVLIEGNFNLVHAAIDAGIGGSYA